MFCKAINSSGEIWKQYMYEIRKDTGKNERRRQVRDMKGTGTRWVENMVEQEGKKNNSSNNKRLEKKENKIP